MSLMEPGVIMARFAKQKANWKSEFSILITKLRPFQVMLVTFDPHLECLLKLFPLGREESCCQSLL